MQGKILVEVIGFACFLGLLDVVDRLHHHVAKIAQGFVDDRCSGLALSCDVVEARQHLGDACREVGRPLAHAFPPSP